MSKDFLTSSFGAPIMDEDNTQTAGQRGASLLQDVHFLEKLSHFDRERTPERVVHAKGSGAFGVFECTEDVSQYTCAHMFQKGVKTEMLARFSTVAGERGSADADRDPRGFALKFYTEQGNYDLVGNNTPVFFIRDAMKFPDFIHTQKRNPRNNLKDHNMIWDFWSLVPESMHQLVILFSDRGTPLTFRHMNGYGSHTYMWYTAKGDYVWVKYHFKTEQGNRTMTRQEAAATGAKDSDHATRDLFEAIEKGEFPSWRLEVQIMTPQQAETFPYDIFDVTKVWPHGLVPPMTIGRMTLNKNPENYFAEIEQAAFNPSNFVPGVAPSPDKMLQGRLFSYHDTHLHRLGANYHMIPVNRARNAKVNTLVRDGFMVVDENGGSAPNYWPNSMGGAPPAEFPVPPALPLSGEARAYPVPFSDLDLEQPRVLYAKVMNDADREHFIGNVAAHMEGVIERIRLRSVAIFWRMDPDCGRRLAALTELDPDKVEKLAAMTQEERVAATAK